MPQLNIYLDEDTARRVDEAAVAEGASRSSWVRQAIRDRLEPSIEGPRYEREYPGIEADPLVAEVRQGQSQAYAQGHFPSETQSRLPAAVGRLRPVVRQQLELEALRKSSDVESLVAEAVETFLLNAGRPLENDPVGASWGAVAADPAQVLRILAEEDSLLDA